MNASAGGLNDLAAQLSAARNHGGAFILPACLVVRLSGVDACRYLKGQVTRDLGRLANNEAVPACILTPKGKLCAPLLIRHAGSDLLVEADPSLEESLLARLQRYIVADDVMVSVELPREGVTVHVFGSFAAARSFQEQGGVRVSRLGVPGWDIEGGFLQKNPGVELLDTRVVETLRIERGIPVWGSELTEETLPPEAGLDRTHIDYDRGCYPGQETISRLKSIGQVRRLLHTLCSPSGCKLAVGMHVLDGEKKKVGMISSASEQFDTGAWVALAQIPRELSGSLFAYLPLTGETTPLSIKDIHGS